MEKRPTLRFLAGREDAGSTPDPAAPNKFKKIIKIIHIFLIYYQNKTLNIRYI